MLRYLKLGNIKIGGSQNGLPQRYNKIFVTKSYKDSGENFVVHPEFKDGVTELKVRLPFTRDLNSTFDARPTSFVTICGYKYIAKIVDNNLIAIPLQESDLSGRILPCINFGAINDVLYSNFQLSNRILLTLFIMNKEGTDYLDSKNGVYLLKTTSKNTFYDTDNTFRLISGMDSDFLRLVNFTLELHTKTVTNSQGELEDISYVRLLPPSQSELIRAAELLKNHGDTLIPTLTAMEINIAESRKSTIDLAFNEQQATAFFGCDELDIQIEENLEEQVSVSEKAKEKKAKEKAATKSKKSVTKMITEGKEPSVTEQLIEEQTKELVSKFPNIKDTVIKSLIGNFGIDEAIVILENNPTLPQVIGEISKRKIPDTDNIQ